MKRQFVSFILMLATCLLAMAGGNTLRIDYIFCGDAQNTAIYLHGMSVTDGWYGRSVNMDRLPVAGNGEICMTDANSGKMLYRSSFSTLFQEWQATPEARSTGRAFENTFLLPMPGAEAVVTVQLFDSHRRSICKYSHEIKPDDILIRRKSAGDVYRQYLHQGGPAEECIDVVILAEGYTTEERDMFLEDAAEALDAIFMHEPFNSMKERFNFLAVAPASADSGVSVPRQGLWKQTAVSSHFDTFYSDRYLTSSHVFDMHDILDGLPYEHLIILANTDTYGGGGIYNSYTLTTAHHSAFRPVVVHEFGHSFGALADEYDYAGEEDPYYFADVEPWEQNITTKFDFASKWQDMLDKGIKGVGLFEGAGYQTKGVWRPAENCRMRTNTASGFCPVCRRAIERMIRFYTEKAE